MQFLLSLFSSLYASHFFIYSSVDIPFSGLFISVVLLLVVFELVAGIVGDPDRLGDLDRLAIRFLKVERAREFILLDLI